MHTFLLSDVKSDCETYHKLSLLLYYIWFKFKNKGSSNLLLYFLSSGWRANSSIIYSSCSPLYLAALLKAKTNSISFLSIIFSDLNSVIYSTKPIFIYYYFSELNFSFNQLYTIFRTYFYSSELISVVIYHSNLN